jgi:perosamine synthetase
MTDLQGAIGLTQLKKLSEFIEERAEFAHLYIQELSEIEWLALPPVPKGGGHAWQAFVTRVDERNSPLSRNSLMAKLLERGISTRPGTHAIHMLQYYKSRFGLKKEDFPNAALCADTTLALPLHNRMLKEDFSYVIDCIKEISR